MRDDGYTKLVDGHYVIRPGETLGLSCQLSNGAYRRENVIEVRVTPEGFVEIFATAPEHIRLQSFDFKS